MHYANRHIASNIVRCICKEQHSKGSTWSGEGYELVVARRTEITTEHGETGCAESESRESLRSSKACPDLTKYAKRGAGDERIDRERKHNQQLEWGAG